jgi:ATP-dependent Clp protease ATP-binding subunit ClpB
MTKQIEASALQGEEDEDSKARRKEVDEQVKILQQKIDKLNQLWKDERNQLTHIKDLKEELAQAKRDLQLARNKGDYAKAGELMHATIPDLKQKVHDLEEQEQQGPSTRKKKLLAEAVTAEEVATIVARHTGIPVSHITDSESTKLLHMEDKLRQRVVGQDHALEAVSNCVRLARTRLQAEDRTLGNFLLVGPSGVGSKYQCMIDYIL